MRIILLGNSGSGKSTLAQWLAGRAGVPFLDLDTVAWEPDQIAVPREPEMAAEDVRAFCRQHRDWVVEGCYANLAAATFEFLPQLLFLNPGERQCMDNCRARPWEPHKYPSKELQDERLSFLIDWVSQYYTRDGAMSLQGHLDCFGTYAGPKRELRTMPDLQQASLESLSGLF